MKLKTYVKKVDPNGEIRISGDYLKELGLYPGEEFALRISEKRLLIEPVKEAVAYKKGHQKSAVDGLVGLIPVGDPKLIDELLASEDVYG